jgi:chemotaxis protein histidine kinase CheA
MKIGLRLSETWFRRGLWLLAFVFAGFLISFGGKVVGDLPKVEQSYQLDDFLDKKTQAQLEQDQNKLKAQQTAQTAQAEELQAKQRAADERVSTSEANHLSWLATRQASEASNQNPEVLTRTRALEALRSTAQDLRQQTLAEDHSANKLRQAQEALTVKQNELTQTAAKAMSAKQSAQDLRVFLYRLALTLPLLIAAGWLFARKRQSVYWPFVWGFIFFALFAFFVELVPYLPSYGGYIRYGVGLVLTGLAGYYAIKKMQSYLAQQALVEQLPEQERRVDLDYEQALLRMAKNACPGCERPINAAASGENFCGHCGMGLFKNCLACSTRNNAFIRYCKACGVGQAAIGAAA